MMVAMKPIVCMAEAGQIARNVPLLTNWVVTFNNYFDVSVKEPILKAEEVCFKTLNETYSAVFVRHSLAQKFIDQIKIPIFAQHEMPFRYIGQFNPRFTYLSDKSYLRYFPKGEEKINLIRKSKGVGEKKYDLLFVGTFGLRSRPKTKLAASFQKNDEAKNYINNFRSLMEIFTEHYASSRKYKIRLKTMSREKQGLTNWSFQHQIREERRSYLVDELEKLVSQGVRICIVTNANGVDYLSANLKEKADIKINVSFENELPQVVSQSKYVVVSTPFHQSILNERFVLALENGSIPIVEPFPQYMQLSSVTSNDLLFDYDHKSLSSVFNGFQKLSDEEYMRKYQVLYNEVLSLYSESEFSKKLAIIIARNSDANNYSDISKESDK